MRTMDAFSIIANIATVVALIFTAISLFLYTEKDKRAYLRIMANSNQLDFSIDLENVGPGLAKIIDIEVKKDGFTVYNKEPADWPALARILNGIMIPDPSIPVKTTTTGASAVNKVVYKKRYYSNFIGDVVLGGGTKHHLFRCTLSDFDSLNILWELFNKLDIIVEYENVYSKRNTENQFCVSNFRRDYQTFKAAIGERKGFII